jgi:hypothetical protein
MNRLTRTTFVAICTALLLTIAAAPAFAQFLRIDRVLAWDTDTWLVWTPAGQTLVVADGDGDTDLDCWVYDRFGNLLAQDTDSTDLCIMRFQKPSSGDLTIRVSNLGDVYNRYELSVD